MNSEVMLGTLNVSPRSYIGMMPENPCLFNNYGRKFQKNLRSIIYPE